MESQSSSAAGRTLTQVDEMLDEFESTADVSINELQGSGEDLEESVEQELNAMEIANTSKSSSEQARRYADGFKEFLRERFERLYLERAASFLQFKFEMTSQSMTFKPLETH